MKITVIGGGSYTWTFGFARDIMETVGAARTELCLMDINSEALAFAGQAVAKLIKDRSSGLRLSTTTELAPALEGADIIMVSISVGGLKTMEPDIVIPERFGIRHTVGDTVGPGGWSRAIRNVPVFHDIAAAMQAACPQAWLLNYSNPMSVLTRVPHKYFGIKTIGMCPGVDSTADKLCRIAGGDPEAEPPEFVNTGIDHGSWFTSLHCGNIDVLATLKAKGFCTASGQLPETVTVDDPHIGEMPASMAVFAAWHELGYLPSISDRHAAENWPWILGGDRSEVPFGIKRTCIEDRRKTYALREQWMKDYMEDKIPEKEVHGHGAGPLTRLIDALHGGDSVTFTANYRNIGQVPGFPDDAVMETRCRFDASGVGPLVSPMPAILKTMVLPHVLRQEMITDIALTGTFNDLVALVTTDPLCAHLNLGQAREMVQAMLEANRDYIRNTELLNF